MAVLIFIPSFAILHTFLDVEWHMECYQLTILYFWRNQYGWLVIFDVDFL